jgi:hypothetical protein
MYREIAERGGEARSVSHKHSVWGEAGNAGWMPCESMKLMKLRTPDVYVLRVVVPIARERNSCA